MPKNPGYLRCVLAPNCLVLQSVSTVSSFEDALLSAKALGVVLAVAVTLLHNKAIREQNFVDVTSVTLLGRVLCHQSSDLGQLDSGCGRVSPA
jgi:hypothetical protein